ncbi:MAG: SH3 domain-containing protein [Nitrospirae bacterium]|nr:SH3 domain-containing protein [Nitrospirota bacterium]
MSSMSLPNVTPRVFCTISGLVVVGLLLSACAGFSLQKKTEGMVPAAELEAERQQRQALQVKQQQLLEELRNQTAAKGELEEQFAAEGLKRQALKQRQEQFEQDLKQQSAVRRALDDGVANLHLLLLEKKAHIARLTEQLEKVILEVVRAKAKLRSLESKAEAASDLAEAEIAVKALKAKGKRWESDPSFIKAEQLTKLSAREFKKGNYGGALYLTSQAKSLIKGARERSMNQEMTSRVAGEVPFVLPLPLQLLSKSNVREGPGLHFKVLYSLAKGTALIGHAYKGQWVRVKSEDGRGGWVFYKLVGAD